MKKITQDKIINFWVDYIEVIGESEKIKKLRFINARDGYYLTFPEFPWFKIKKVSRVMNYWYKIVFKKDWFDCFAYHKWQVNWDVETYDFLAVYGVAFKIFDNIAEIIDFVNANIVVEKLRRFDLAIDVLFPVDEIYKAIIRKNRKVVTFSNNIWELQTFYIWEKKKSQNRYKLLRCYNKIDDIKRNKRQRLYVDYLMNHVVSRIEIEFRSELCWSIALKSLLDRSYIFDVFLSYINQYTDIFSWFNYDKIRLAPANKKSSIELLMVDEILRQKYLRSFLGYWKTILEIWACPVDILITLWYISENTMKNIILSIKDWEFKQDLYSFWLNTRYLKNTFLNDEEDDHLNEYMSNQDNYD